MTMKGPAQLEVSDASVQELKASGDSVSLAGTMVPAEEAWRIGLVDELAERGLQVDYHTVWDFVHGEKLTYKKRRWSPASGTGRT